MEHEKQDVQYVPFLDPSGCMSAQFSTVEKIMADDNMSTLFGQLVEKCLCGESFWFLTEVSDKPPHGWELCARLTVR